ncbi:MAG TPA: hypothetical protein ENF37_09415 [Beggiatoa sp.]|nr:hypothetical protein [Beggiatoa sp.]
MVGSKKTLPTLRGMVLSLNVTNKTVRDNYFLNLMLTFYCPPAQIAAHQQSTRLASISAEQKAIINNAAGDMLGFYGYT